MRPVPSVNPSGLAASRRVNEPRDEHHLVSIKVRLAPFWLRGQEDHQRSATPALGVLHFVDGPHQKIGREAQPWAKPER